MPAIIGAIVAFFVKWVAVRVAFWLVVKGAILFFGVFIFPVILYNFVTGLLEEYLQWVSTAISEIDGGSMTSAVLTFSSFGAWLAIKLKIAEAFAILISAIKIRLMMMMIPGVK